MANERSCENCKFHTKGMPISDSCKVACLKNNYEYWQPKEQPAPAKPNIICLCGSTRFTNEMLTKAWELTKQGNIVIHWNILPASYVTDAFNGDNHIADREGVKQLIDELYKRKIDLADEVLVLNIGGYIGESTRSEINYAIKIGKPVNYVEAINGK